jgi:hypothetical protein
MFDAIHLLRDRPDCTNMIRCEDKVLPLAKYAAKRAGKIAIKELKAKISK